MTRILAISPGDGRDLTPWLHAMDIDAILLRERTENVTAPAALAASLGLKVHVHTTCPDRPTADFLHLRANDPTPDAPFGVSCHDADELEAAFERGASYALLSPVFHPTSKPEDTRSPLGRDTFIKLAGGRPVYALGGITVQTAFPAWGVAVLGHFFAVEPAIAGERSRQLRRALQNANSVSS